MLRRWSGALATTARSSIMLQPIARPSAALAAEHHLEPRNFMSNQTRSFHSSVAIRNHYKVLDVSPTASKTEIKQAYLTLSKKYHPDSNAGATENDRSKAHKSFIKVGKAFEVLNDSSSRQSYDSELFRSNGFSSHEYGYTRPSYEYPEYQVFHGKSPYQMVSNSTIVIMIVGWMILGIVWHYFAISKTKTELEKFLEARSQAAAENHAVARQRARENGYKKQLELLRHKHELVQVNIASPANKLWFDRYKYDIPVLHINGQYLTKHRVTLEDFDEALQAVLSGQFSSPEGDPNPEIDAGPTPAISDIQ